MGNGSWGIGHGAVPSILCCSANFLARALTKLKCALGTRVCFAKRGLRRWRGVGGVGITGGVVGSEALLIMMAPAIKLGTAGDSSKDINFGLGLAFWSGLAWLGLAWLRLA